MKIRWSADSGPADCGGTPGVALRPRVGRRGPAQRPPGRPQAQGGRVRRALNERVVTVERTRTIAAPTPARETKGDCGSRRSPGCQRDDA
jgi:hypothetical protein